MQKERLDLQKATSHMLLCVLEMWPVQNMKDFEDLVCKRNVKHLICNFHISYILKLYFRNGIIITSTCFFLLILMLTEVLNHMCGLHYASIGYHKSDNL